MGKEFGYCALLSLLLCTLFVGLARHSVLEVRDMHGKLLLQSFMPKDAEFGIGFIHSVAKSPVEDWFSEREGQVALNRTVYQDFGAGLPHEAGPGQKMFFRDGRVEITGYSLLLPQLEVRVGRVARHVLLLPGKKSIPLALLAPPGAALSFSFHSTSALEVWVRQRVLLRN